MKTFNLSSSLSTSEPKVVFSGSIESPDVFGSRLFYQVRSSSILDKHFFFCVSDLGESFAIYNSDGRSYKSARLCLSALYRYIVRHYFSC